MIDEWNDNQENIFCDFTFEDIPSYLSDSLRISLYRITQEGLTNTLKYSKASKVNVNIRKVVDDGVEKINLKIEDNGIGMDKDGVKPGFGILGMRERVEMNEGEFAIDSAPEAGVKINILVPLSK
tara:strand:- start:209 stop:583 length:375 start_codon:yes stop_codon:yes gene_type:complete